MKFISKSSNLLIVLRPGLPAQPITGTLARPAVSVRFKDGLAEVPDGELADMMLKHPGFDSDFIAAGEIGMADPYAYMRQANEPQHQITEMKFGTPVGRKVSGGTPALSPEMRKMIQDMATSLAKEMLPAMVEATLKSIVATRQNNEPEVLDQTTSEDKNSQEVSGVKTTKKAAIKKEKPAKEDEKSTDDAPEKGGI